jgi:hypothetical protein
MYCVEWQYYCASLPFDIYVGDFDRNSSKLLLHHQQLHLHQQQSNYAQHIQQEQPTLHTLPPPNFNHKSSIMASVIIAATVFAGIKIHEHKEKKQEKKRLAQEALEAEHGQASLTVPQQTRHRPSQDSLNEDLPSYEAAVVNGQQRARNSTEKPRRQSAERQVQPPRYSLG